MENPSSKEVWVPDTPLEGDCGLLREEEASYGLRYRLQMCIRDSSYGGGSTSTGGEQGNNNFLTRYWLAATKHFEFRKIGTLGVHACLLYTST